MSLYKDASLVMIPSAYKDGKLYSIRPTDGSGDFTFSRGSNLAATRVDVNGLIEKGRENLLLQSNQFDTTWGNANSTDTGGQQGYDGSNDAWLIESTNTDGRIEQSTSYGSGVRTFSCYAKAGTSGLIRLRMQGGANAFADFDLDNGVVDFVDNDVINATIVSVGNGWYRCSINTNDTNTKVYIYVMGASGLNLYIQDAQLEAGLVATDYIETGASTAQAGILEDMPRLDYSGGATCPSLLLEPSRTNNHTHSNYFGASYYIKDSGVSITTNDATSPEGVQNASKVSVSSSGRIYANHTSGTYTTSVFIKAGTFSHFRFIGQNVDLTTSPISVGSLDFDDYGNGWYRIYGSYTGNRGFQIQAYPDNTYSSHTDNGDYYIYGAQLEQGSYPTSYIPTYGSSVTRSQDTLGTLSNLKSDDLIGTTSLTWFIEMSKRNLSSLAAYPRIQDGGNNIIGISTDANRLVLSLRIDGGSFDNPTLLSGYDNEMTKICLQVIGNEIKAYVNGSLKITRTCPSPDLFTSMLHNIGLDKDVKYKQLVLFPTALTDSECIALTSI